MFMKEKLFKTIVLDSGLTVNLYDASKKMNPDRWFVSFIIRMDIPVAETVLNKPEPSDPARDDIARVLGPSISFEQKIERVFIPDSQKEELFHQFYDSFITGSLGYFSHPSFAKNFIIKKYRELKRS